MPIGMPSEEVQLALRLAGASQAFRSTSLLSQIQNVLLLKKVHASGAYKALGMTWDGYCEQVVGIPRSTAYDAFKTLEKLGEDFIVATEQLGLGHATYRALRRLPESERPKLLDTGEIEVADQRIPLDKKHREQVKDLIEDLISRASTLKERIDEGEEQLEERDEQMAALRKEIKELQVSREPIDGVLEIDKACIALVAHMKRLADRLEQEQPDRQRVRGHVQLMEAWWSRLVQYAMNYHVPELDPEKYDVDALEEIDREMTRAEQAGEIL